MSFEYTPNRQWPGEEEPNSYRLILKPMRNWQTF